MINRLYSAGGGLLRHAFTNVFHRRASASEAALLLLLAAGLAQPLALHAVPYASGLTNAGGTISFRLNEAADNVRIISNGGAVTNDLGARAAGLHTENLGITGAFSVVVSKAAPPGYLTASAPNRATVLQISTDNNLVRFNQPRGLAVNTDPASPYFGRVYVANSAAGTAGTRTVGDGIYILNSDLSDALGRGDTASTGGLDFGATASPYRLTIGQDGYLYIADWSDTTGSLYRTDPDVSPGSGVNVLGGPTGSGFPVTSSRVHGSIAAAVVEGSLAAGNLRAYVIDEDLQSDPDSSTANMRNSMWYHDLGSSLPGPATMPTLFHTAPWIASTSQTMDMSRGTNGYFYVNTYRSAGTDRAGLYVTDAFGNDLWNSLQASQGLGGSADFLRATGGGAVSPDQKFCAVINIETNGITLVPLDASGLPDLANRLQFNGFGTTTAQGREVAFDIAGNLYAVSSGAQLLRVFSPGGTTVATTTSDGTFQLYRPPGVSVTAADPQADEFGANSVMFVITRTGTADAPLTVQFTLGGTASNGVDYAQTPLSVTMPAGITLAEIIITPTFDNLAELTETIVLSLVPTFDYDVAAPSSATATIADSQVPNVLTITPADTNAYERTPGDTASFTITRYGALDTEITASLQYSGTATLNQDYTAAPDPVVFGVGESTKTITITPLDDAELDAGETVTVTLLPSTDYTPGDPAQATLTLRDDEPTPATVLFGDDFEADSSANWIQRFGANNGVYDATVNFSYDYVTAGIPLAPRSAPGSSRGLYIAVNKTNSTGLGSAGINFYPAGRTFSGDYALRFDMFLNFGTAGTTEHALAGLNHSGLFTNRVSQSTDTNNTTRGGDGVWVAIETDASNNRDYTAYSVTNPASFPVILASRSASSVARLIPSPPYAFAGSPGNSPTSTKTWADVELSQVAGVITLKVNGVVILQYTNTTGFASGNIMIGHNDQFDSVGSADNYVVFDNVQVVDLSFPVKSMRLVGNEVQVDFQTPFGGSASNYFLQSTPTLSPPAWADDPTAVIAPTTNGFRATATPSGSTRYYRIRH